MCTTSQLNSFHAAFKSNSIFSYSTSGVRTKRPPTFFSSTLIARFKNYYDQVLITKDAESEKVAIVRSAFEIAPRLAEAWMSFRDSNEDLRSLIPLIKMPVLFAWASQDQYVQWERNKDAISRFTNKKIVHFPAGHAPFLETPDRFNEETKTFFSEISFN